MRQIIEHPHVELLRSAYEAFAGGDMDSLGDLLAHDAFALVGGRNLLSGMHRGAPEVLGLFRTMLELSDVLELDIHDILANDDHGMAIVNVKAARGDLRYEQFETHVFELAESKIEGLFVYWNDPAPADQFFR